ncbi:nicotinate (nicotinamide) nucleotide adenylyltransferase [Parvibaculum lavamentivorans DS-1]|uniref:Probable nicotinate-nucleotide adenylyltransferase n=1 Tax=Parvibaculum lavamentivorans (strain DS-1 / DSM 13023 / NCIMB 13966) TaxID=402881 RepID=NADD_PARL1|nr:nicotinate-nucleotide adenylyltransferase [Parvibaculum lavamentivorans]A7HT64.1 RecName: Full=Probable nicotinate-nucleotide adenylyltransferase; AltName: Full=Deamido-NAD(+) diphosphorylase; AltName: Full=Deamido-NAD(+) pyrophosphorylase; AltName: Full=Nicotinate mononucleotide adenylyltransferase; Short=NaMN adenylyltransferase [Parvibaculum lavamentivorans DS-1]ABS63097.1 nicotinate (nicotinamide) nucleotide adenylyltransferase [Parvibaculum lavamentivorans DS-1]
MARRELLTPGLKVGLLGGSFNPAHEGHLHVTRMCLRALGLDRVWWLVSPQNPLKSDAGMASFDRRLASAEKMARDPRICVSDIEARLGTRYTVDTLAALTSRFPQIRFVWLMGADNLIQLPHWARWRDIVQTVPIAVYPRPGFTLKARLSPAATALRDVTLDATDAALLPLLTAPALAFLDGPESSQSATSIRERGGWSLR